MASKTVKADVDEYTLAKGVNKLTIPRLTLPDAVKPTDDKDDLVKQMSDLSPTTQEHLNVLLKSISNGDATIDTDADGKTKIDYKPAKKILWDGSNANIITKPKSDVDIQLRVDSCLELVQYMKDDKPPSGVLLDSTKISLSKKKDYQLGHEFTKTEKVLGSGNSAGDIVILKDIKTGEEHAHKTMMISCFRTNEIRCWVDLNDTGYVPHLYLFKIEGNRMSVHMEILKDAKTLRCIIDEHWAAFHSSESSRSLLRPFSLFVLDGAMEALSAMHSKGWVHKDLHPGNAMIQKKSEKKLAVKILDFGLASRFNSKGGGLDYRGFKADISEVLRMFSALYSGLEFNNAYDIQTNWKKEIIGGSQMIKMGVDEKEELFCLVEAAMALVQPDDVQEYRNLVKEKLNNAMGDQHSEEEIMKKVVGLLFPDEFQDIHGYDNTDKSHDVVDCPGAQQVFRDSVPRNATSNTNSEAVDKLIKKIRMQLAISSVQPE